MRYYTISAILLLSCIATNIRAQDVDSVKLDSLFSILASKNKAMGSVVLMKNGKVLYSHATGYSFVSPNKVKMATVDTRYRVGSISKMFTATMIMQLVQEGKLSLNQNLEKFFPTLPNAKKITISNLLNHRSGLHNFTSDADYQSWMEKPKTREELMAIIIRNPADFPPDQKASYSNANYLLLGWIIEDVRKQSYSTVLFERINDKIGLKHTYVGMKPDTANNESFSFRFNRVWQPETVTDMSIPGGAGVIVSTPYDLCVFIQALFNGDLLADSNVLRMKTMTDGFGMGMFKYPFNGKSCYGHTGGIDGFSSMVTYFPEDSLALAYCSNGLAYSMNDIVLGTLNIYFKKPYALPVFRTVLYRSEDLDKYMGLYSSLQMPMKINISKDSSSLIAQASGQSSFKLEATERDKFQYDQAGIRMEFNPDRKEMILKQGGGVYLFTREK